MTDFLSSFINLKQQIVNSILYIHYGIFILFILNIGYLE